MVLFAQKGKQWSVDRKAVQRLLPANGVLSIQLTFDESIAPEGHHMPEGGFRLAIINCWDISRSRESHAGDLARHVCSTVLLIKTRIGQEAHIQLTADQPEVQQKLRSKRIRLITYRYRRRCHP